MDRFRDPDSDLGLRTMPNPARKQLREMEDAQREHSEGIAAGTLMANTCAYCDKPIGDARVGYVVTSARGLERAHMDCCMEPAAVRKTPRQGETE